MVIYPFKTYLFREFLDFDSIMRILNIFEFKIPCNTVIANIVTHSLASIELVIDIHTFNNVCFETLYTYNIIY